MAIGAPGQQPHGSVSHASRAVERVADFLDLTARTVRGVAHLVDRDPAPVDELDVISPEEGRKIFDSAAMTHLNMSGDEFAKRWDAGEFHDVDEPDVMRVAMLLPLGR